MKRIDKLESELEVYQNEEEQEEGKQSDDEDIVILINKYI